MPSLPLRLLAFGNFDFFWRRALCAMPFCDAVLATRVHWPVLPVLGCAQLVSGLSDALEEVHSPHAQRIKRGKSPTGSAQKKHEVVVYLVKLVRTFLHARDYAMVLRESSAQVFRLGLRCISLGGK